MNIKEFLKTRKPLLASLLFYFSFALFIASIFCYMLLLVKIYLQDQRLDYLDAGITSYASDQQKEYQTKFTTYKKEIDDFTKILNTHKISSNILVFIESNTLPNVWFSNFDMSQSLDQVKLSGEADSMAVLSDQVQYFEHSGHVTNIGVLNSQPSPNGKIKFIMTLSLDPKIFSYSNNPFLLYQ